MKFLLSSVFLLMLAPCNKSHTASSDAAADENIKTMKVVYECTPCFGKCPAYVMTIDGSNGAASFTGKSNTTKEGRWTKTVSAEELKTLAKAFETEKFFELNDSYLGNITDFPSKYITLTWKEKTKKVQDRSGGPESLHRLEKMLSDIAESEGWKKDSSGEN